MADVTDPQAIAFCNQLLRPNCERAERFKVKHDEALTDWFAGINTLIPNDPDAIIQDGREEEGVSRITGADVHNAMSVLVNMAGQYNDQIIAKPTVRPLEVT